MLEIIEMVISDSIHPPFILLQVGDTVDSSQTRISSQPKVEGW